MCIGNSDDATEKLKSHMLSWFYDLCVSRVCEDLLAPLITLEIGFEQYTSSGLCVCSRLYQL